MVSSGSTEKRAKTSFPRIVDITDIPVVLEALKLVPLKPLHTARKRPYFCCNVAV